jgi:hypothetical protein
MIDERKDPELEQVAACFETLTGRVEELVDAGMKASRKVYYQGKLEVYERLLANLSNFDQGIDSFFMGSLWNDIKSSKIA